MRIISGFARGMSLNTPAAGKKGIRPTSDRVREALFSILGQRVVGARVLDLFAGTGALGLEALSRGASKAVFVDHSAISLGLIKKNILKYPSTENVRETAVVKKDLSGHFAKSLAARVGGDFDLIFADPPYGRGLATGLLREVEKSNLLDSKGLLVLEERAQTELPQQTELLLLTDSRVYGDTAISFYQCSKS